MVTEQLNNTPEKKPRKKPVRSRYQFPSYDFGIARQIAEKVEFEGAGHLSEETLAISLGVSAKSSGYRLKTLTARQFRLLTKERDMLATTPLAKAILKPTTNEEKGRKMAESFMTIPLFNAVATRFKGQPLPPSESFRNILDREFGVESNRVGEAERVLFDSAREAGLLHESGGKTYLTTEAIASTQYPGIPLASSEASLPSGTSVMPPREVNTPPSSGLLTVSEQDFADLNDVEFNEVWQALGKIMKARGKRLRTQQEESDVEEEKEIQEQELE
ncbi:hypothetical protein ACFLW0_06475 [Chloroflexota bacterium]